MTKPPVASILLAVLGVALLVVGIAVNVVTAVVTSVVWYQYPGLLGAMIWALPYLAVCALLGTAWAGPLYLASVIVSAIGVGRRGWARWLGVPALVLGALALAASLGTWLLLLLVGVAPWAAPPAS